MENERRGFPEAARDAQPQVAVDEAILAEYQLRMQLRALPHGILADLKGVGAALFLAVRLLLIPVAFVLGLWPSCEQHPAFVITLTVIFAGVIGTSVVASRALRAEAMQSLPTDPLCAQILQSEQRPPYA